MHLPSSQASCDLIEFESNRSFEKRGFNETADVQLDQNELKRNKQINAIQRGQAYKMQKQYVDSRDFAFKDKHFYRRWSTPLESIRLKKLVKLSSGHP